MSSKFEIRNIYLTSLFIINVKTVYKIILSFSSLLDFYFPPHISPRHFYSFYFDSTPDLQCLLMKGEEVYLGVDIENLSEGRNI